jgi:hypothetical protein
MKITTAIMTPTGAAAREIRFLRDGLFGGVSGVLVGLDGFIALVGSGIEVG